MFSVLFLMFSFNPTFQSADLLFKSSFEKGVYLEAVDRKDSSIWWQELKGSDNGKFSWPINLHGKDGSFQMIVKDEDISKYIENSLVEMTGIDGKSTRALHQEIKEKETPWTQNPYVVYTQGNEHKKIYLRYSLKFPDNLAEQLGENGWLTFCEYKTTSDYRLAFYIYSDKNKKLYWYVHGDNAVSDDKPYKEFWYRENFTPIDTTKWMDVEIYWNRSKDKKGQVWMAVNGDVIFNYKGATKIKEPINMMMLFTNYSNTPISQWIDNIEIWSDFPCGKEKSCSKNKRSKYNFGW